MLQPTTVNLLDRIVLFFKRVEIDEVNRVTENCIAISGRRRRGDRRVVYLKFSYPGNLQYHEIQDYEWEKYELLFSSLKKSRIYVKD